MHPLFSDPWEDHPAVSVLPEALDAGVGLDAGVELPKILDSQLPRSCAGSFQLDLAFSPAAAELACGGLAGAAAPLCAALCAPVPVCAFALLAMAMIMTPVNTT